MLIPKFKFPLHAAMSKNTKCSLDGESSQDIVPRWNRIKKSAVIFFSQESEKVDFDKTGQIQNAKYNEKSMTNNF